MEDSFDVNGKAYVSSKRLAEKYGYTNDHISRLCRQGKVQGKRVARTWFVDEDDLVSYQSEMNGNGWGNGHAQDAYAKDTTSPTETAIAATPLAREAARQQQEARSQPTSRYTPEAIDEPFPNANKQPRKTEEAEQKVVPDDDMPNERGVKPHIAETTSTSHSSRTHPLLQPVALPLRNAVLFLSILSLFSVAHAVNDPTHRDALYEETAKFVFGAEEFLTSSKSLAIGEYDDTLASVASVQEVTKTFIDTAALSVYRSVEDAKVRTQNRILSWLGIPNGVQHARNDTFYLGGLPNTGFGSETDQPRVVQETRVVERVVERQVDRGPIRAQTSGISRDVLETRLQEVENGLRQQIFAVRGDIPESNSIKTVTRTVAHTNRIDKLDNVTISNATVDGVSGLTDSDIPDGLTASNYLPLAGGTLTGALTGTDATFSGALTTQGSVTFYTEPSFPSFNATSTTATSTIAGSLEVDGDLTVSGSQSFSGGLTLPYFSATSTATSSSVAYRLGIGTTSPYATLSVSGSAVVTDNITASNFTATSSTASVFPYASSTAITTTSFFPTDIYSFTLQGDLLANGQNITGIGTATGTNSIFTNATTTNATSTNFFTSILDATTGTFTNLTTVTYDATSGTTTNATSTNFFTALLDATTGTITNFTATDATTTNATSTNLFTQNFTADGKLTLNGVGTDMLLSLNSANELTATSTPTLSHLFATSTTATSTFAGGINIGSGNFVVDFTTGFAGAGTAAPIAPLHVAGRCVTGDTRLRRRRRRLPAARRRKHGRKGAKGTTGLSDAELSKRGFVFDDDYVYDEVEITYVKEGDEVASLDPKTGMFVYSKVNNMMPMGIKPIVYIRTTTGRSIRTTENHPYLVRSAPPKEAEEQHTQKLYRFEVDQSVKIEDFSRDTVVAVANAEQSFTLTIPRKEKQRLRDNMRRFNKPKKLNAVVFALGIAEAMKRAPFTIHELAIDTEYIGYEHTIAGIIADAFPQTPEINFLPVGKKSPAHFAAIGVHKQEKTADTSADTAAFTQTENALRTAAFPTKARNLAGPGAFLDSTVYDGEQFVKRGVWTTVNDIRVGQYIAVAHGGTPAWERVEEMKILPEEQVYDIEIEGTHNFIGNDVVAHNTYLNGDVGIKQASPTYDLDVSGDARFTGLVDAARFVATSTTATSTFAGGLSAAGASGLTVLQDGTVGIGTTSPSSKLSVHGDALFSGDISTANLTATGTASISGTASITGAVTLSNTTGGILETDSSGTVSATTTINDFFISDALTISSSGSVADGALSSNVSLLGQTIESSEITDGTVANVDLANSSLSYGGVSVSLGGTDATPAFDLTDATSLPITGGTTGTLTVARGGTGQTTHTAGNLLYGAGSGALQNVATTTATIGPGLSYSGTFGSLVGGANGTLTLDADASDLNDVDTTGAATSNILMYNGTNWVTQATSSDMLQDEVTLTGTPNYITLNGQELTLTKLDLTDDVNTFTEANLYTQLTDVTQFWEAGDTLSSGSISSGFGNIDIGSSNLDADGTITFGGLGTDMLTSINASGQLVATSTPTVSHLFATSTTATSTFAGGLEANALNITATNATSTFANGIQLSSGCFLLPSGECAGTGSGSGGAFTSSGGITSLNTETDDVGIGTSSPYAKLSVWGESASSGLAFNAVNSASTTLFSIPNDASATSTFATNLQVNGNLQVGSGTLTLDSGGITSSGAFQLNSGGANFTFPTSDGSNNQVLTTDGSGTLSFTSLGSNAFFSTSSTAIANDSFLELTHNSDTNDLLITGWVFNSDTSKWESVNENDNQDGYQNYKPITIDSTKASSTLTNFPLTFSVTDADLKTTGNGGDIQNTDSTGGASGSLTVPADLVFASTTACGAGDQLDHEVEKYNSSTGELVAHVRIPTLSGSSDTTIYMCYGDKDVATSQENVTGVWDSNYKMVQHMNEDPSGTAPQMYDSTSNNNDGTSNGSMTSGDQISGQIDGSIDYDGSDDYIQTSSTAISSVEFTVSAYLFLKSGQTGAAYILGQNSGGWTTTGLEIQFNAGDKISFSWTDGSSSDPGTARYIIQSEDYDKYTHFVFTRNSSGELNIYKNGSLVTGPVSNNTLTSNNLSYAIVGGKYVNNSGTNFTAHRLDEIKAYSGLRSAEWIATEYNNQSSTSTFYTVGSESSVNTQYAIEQTDPNTLRLYNYSGSSQQLRLSAISSAAAGEWTDQGTYISANNATDVVITDTSRLGIGTTSPSSKFTVYGNAFLEGANRYLNFGATTSVASTGYGFRDNSGTLQFKNANGTWSDLGSGGAFTSSGGFTTLSTETDDVGIGTSSPYAKLSVWGESASTGLAFNAVNSASTTLFSIPNDASATSTFATNLQVNGNLQVGSGTLTLDSNSITSSGQLTLNGTGTTTINTNLDLGASNELAFGTSKLRDNSGTLEFKNASGAWTSLGGGDSYTNVLDESSFQKLGATIPGGLVRSQTAVIGNHVYLFGGHSGSGPDDVIYRATTTDPTSWSDTAATLPGNLRDSQLVVIGDYVYLFGGYNGTSEVDTIYRAPVSDPTSWTDTGSTLPGSLSLSQAAVIGDHVYLFGGASSDVIYRATTTDPTDWANTGNTLPTALGWSQVAVIGNYVYLFGGDTTNVIYRAPVSDPTNWTNTGSTIPGNLRASQVAVIGNFVYLFGGWSGSATNVIYRAPVSDPTNWTNTGLTLPSNFRETQLAVIDDHVYLFGGYDGSISNVIYSANITSRIDADATVTDHDEDLNSNGWKYLPNGSNSNTASYFAQNGNTLGALATLGTNDNFGLAFETNGTERARFDTSGNFGIGTTTPHAKLTVNGGSGPQFLLTDPNGAVDQKHVYASSTNGALAFGELDDSLSTYTEHMRIDASGNVGIGTSSPASTLDVWGDFRVGTSSTPALFTDVSTGRVGVGTAGPSAVLDVSVPNSTYDTKIFEVGSGQTDDWGDMFEVWRLSPAQGQTFVRGRNKLHFASNVNSATPSLSDSQLTISSGDVGIGTTSPNSKLDVKGALEFGTASRGAILTSNATDNFQLKTWTNTPNPNFDIGIGDGAGGIATTWLHGNASGDISGTHGTYHSASDKRLKTNIQTASGALDKVLSLRGVTYEWIDPDAAERDGTRYGLIAQEARDVVPQVVHYNEGTGLYAVEYQQLHGLTIEAIKELNTRTAFIENTFGTSTRMYIDEQGNVGIGENPQQYGAGTSTLEHALTVDGDVAATGFVNVSSGDFKKNVREVTEEEREGMLEKLQGLFVATYHYNREEYCGESSDDSISNSPNSSNSPNMATTSATDQRSNQRQISGSCGERLGLIAEQAPEEVLSPDGRGVDLYKFVTFVASAVQAIADKVEALADRVTGNDEKISELEERISELENQLSNSPNSPNSSNSPNDAPAAGDNEAPVITINGNNPAQVDVGASYNDLGAIVTDNEDDNLGVQASVNGTDVGDQSNVSIDTSVAGEHTVEYRATDNAGNTGTATRTVIVGGGADDNQDTSGTNSPNSSNSPNSPNDANDDTASTTPETTEPVDTTAPEITLEGSANMELTVGDSYSEPGYSATDDTNGDITSEVVVGGDTVDTSTTGTYTVTYNVSDAAGNAAAEKTRTITVVEPEPAPEEEETSTDTATSTSEE